MSGVLLAGIVASQRFGASVSPDAAVASVTISGTASVGEGATTQLVATVKDAQGNVLIGRTVNWSSDSASATVDSAGLVTGVTAGTANITATCETVPSAPYEVTVTTAQQVAVNSVEVSPAAFTVDSGSTRQLTAIVRDVDGNILLDRVVSWESDAIFATVSSIGLVTGRSEGQATITATCEGKSGTSVATVQTAIPIDPSNYQLADGFYVSRKMDMTIIHPRPDAETDAADRHRNAYPGIPYRIPIVVQGGAWPFRFELADGPTGMSIGQTLDIVGDVLKPGSEYGVLSWANPTDVGMPVGGWPVTVRVYDQDYQRATNPSAYAEISFTLNVNTAAFVFFDGAAATDGDGSLASPYNSWTSLWGDTSGAAVNAGKIAVFRAGTYSLTGFSDTTNATIARLKKPNALLGYPGEQVIFNCQAAKIILNTTDGFFTSGIKWQNPRTDSGTNAAQFFTTASNTARITWFEMEFGDQANTAAINNNPGCIYLSKSSGERQYIAVSRVTKSGITESIYKSYKTAYQVVEYVTLEGADVSITDGSGDEGLIFLKDEPRFATIRACTLIPDSVTSSQRIGIAVGGQAGLQSVEVCYCTEITTSDATQVTYHFGMNDPSGDLFVGDTWMYRTTSRGKHQNAFSAPGVWLYEDYILITSDSTPFPASSTQLDCLQGVTADGIIDNTTGALAGSYRTTYLGTRGAEIAAAALGA